MPDSPRFAYEVRPGLIEVPVTTLRWRGRNYPSSGGGWFRLLPYGMTRWMIERFNRIEGRSAVFYFHPWEIDPGQPRVADAPFRSRLRHYSRLAAMAGKLERLIAGHRWGRVDQVAAEAARRRQ